MNDRDKKSDQECEGQSIFGANTDIAERKPYTGKELRKSRYKYYILCSVIGIFIVVFAILTTVLAPVDKRQYKDYPTIAKKEEQLDRSEGKYYLYYYSRSCGICDGMRSDLFDFMDRQEKEEEPTIVYMASIDELFAYSGAEPESFIGIADYEDIYVGRTPTLLKVEAKTISGYFLGADKISAELHLS